MPEKNDSYEEHFSINRLYSNLSIAKDDDRWVMIASQFSENKKLL